MERVAVGLVAESNQRFLFRWQGQTTATVLYMHYNTCNGGCDGGRTLAAAMQEAYYVLPYVARDATLATH